MVGGLIAGGLLGSLLSGGGGLGFTGLAVFGVLAYLALRRMRAAQAGPATAYAQSSAGPAMAARSLDGGNAYALAREAGQGTGTARRPEPILDEAEVSRVVTDIFLKVQMAWAARDMEQAANVLTPEMRAQLQKDCDQMRAQGRINRLENVQVRRVEVTETWQEPGRNFMTVLIEASLLDDVVDEKTGAVLEGGAVEPVAFTEYWTLTRAVWVKAWRLTAIQQPAVTSA